MTDAHSALARGYQAMSVPVDPFEGITGPFFERRESDGSGAYAFQVLDKHTDLADVAQCGMLMSFADMVAAQAAFAANGGDDVVTLSMSTAFLAPARAGDLVECRPRLIRRTAEILFIDGEFMVGKTVILSSKSLWKTIRMRPNMAKIREF